MKILCVQTYTHSMRDIKLYPLRLIPSENWQGTNEFGTQSSIGDTKMKTLAPEKIKMSDKNTDLNKNMNTKV